MLKIFFTLVLGLTFASVSLGDQTPGSSRCMYGCEVPPKCESLIDMNQYELWGVAVIKVNPHPGNYQIESYGIPGTPQNPGHIIFVSYGYHDAQNPNGDCRIEMIDGVSAPVHHTANINPAPEVFANAGRDLVHQTIDPFMCSTPTCNDGRYDVPARPLGQATEAHVNISHGKVFATEGPYTSGGQIIFKFGMKRKSESNANGDLFDKKANADDNNPYNLP